MTVIPASMALAERLDAPVCVGYQHNDAFPGSHPLFAGPLGYNGSKAGMELIAQADVVLALGTRLNPFSTLPGYGLDYWPKEAKIIQVDINPDRIGATGGSAGGCSSLYLALHDDLADAKSADPVARQSTRLLCAAVIGAQTTLDPRQAKEWTPNSRYGGHAFGRDRRADAGRPQRLQPAARRAGGGQSPGQSVDRRQLRRLCRLDPGLSGLVS